MARKKTKKPSKSHVNEANLFEHLDLKTVRLISSGASLKITDGIVPETAQIKSNAKVSPGDGTIVVTCTATLLANAETKTTGGSEVVVGAEFQCIFSLKNATIKEIQPHAELVLRVGTSITYPYIREFIQSTIARMQITPFVLPLYTIGAGLTMTNLHEKIKTSGEESEKPAMP